MALSTSNHSICAATCALRPSLVKASWRQQDLLAAAVPCQDSPHLLLRPPPGQSRAARCRRRLPAASRLASMRCSAGSQSALSPAGGTSCLRAQLSCLLWLHASCAPLAIEHRQATQQIYGLISHACHREVSEPPASLGFMSPHRGNVPQTCPCWPPRMLSHPGC